MRLVKVCLVAFVASAGVIVGLGIVGVLATPPEQRPSHIRRQARVGPRDLWRPSSRQWDDEPILS